MTLSSVLGIALAVSLAINVLQYLRADYRDAAARELERRLKKNRKTVMERTRKYAELLQFSTEATDRLEALQVAMTKEKEAFEQEISTFSEQMQAVVKERDREIQTRHRYYEQQLDAERRLHLTEANSHRVQQIMIAELARILRMGAQHGVDLRVSPHIQGMLHEYIHETGRDESLGPWVSNVPPDPKELSQLPGVCAPQEKLSQSPAPEPDVS